MRGTFKYLMCLGAIVALLTACNENKIGESEFGTLKGVVVASGTNEPLANARVSTDPLSSTVFTDSAGKYRIENIQAGDYQVEARKEGYITSTEPTTIVGEVVTDLVFELEVSTATNRPPSTPVLLTPEENEVLGSIEAVFTWTSTDPEGDPITYSIELRNDQNNDVLIFEDIEEQTFTYSELILGTKYFWQVSASDGINAPVISSIGTFEVMGAPSDNRFLFTRNIDGNNVIFSADEAGNEFQLTSSTVNSYRPRRNVAANRIAYLQSDGAEVDIYTMKRDGSDKQRVTSAFKPNGFNLNEINISWPPNSDRIYFPQFDKLYRINTDGQGIALVYQTPDGSLISEVDVSENTDLIALKTNNLNGYDIHIYTIDFSGTMVDDILDGVMGAAGGLNMSVTNRQVVYSYDVSGFEDLTYRRLDSRIFVYDLDSATATDVSDNKPSGTNDLEPIFSPNEAFVIFTNTSNDGISQKDIYQLEIGAMGTRTLLFSDAFMPDWE